MLRYSILIVFFVRSCYLFCQTSYPQSDLLLFKWAIKSDSCSLEFIQSFIPNDSNAYINQPFFASDSIVYFNMLQKEHNTTEIFTYNVNNSQSLQSTFTPKISEFSPQIQPDARYFSVVRIEEDGKTQTLWSYPIDKMDKGKRLATWISNMGYYVWLDENEILAFLVDSVHQLKRIDLKNEAEHLITLNPGRTLKKINSNLFIFLDKSIQGTYILNTYNKSSGRVNKIIEWPFPTEDFDILDEKYIIASSKNKLFVYSLNKKEKWTEIVDIERLGYKTISRISSHPSGKLILVTHK